MYVLIGAIIKEKVKKRIHMRQKKKYAREMLKRNKGMITMLSLLVSSAFLWIVLLEYAVREVALSPYILYGQMLSDEIWSIVLSTCFAVVRLMLWWPVLLGFMRSLLLIEQKPGISQLLYFYFPARRFWKAVGGKLLLDFFVLLLGAAFLLPGAILVFYGFRIAGIAALILGGVWFFVKCLNLIEPILWLCEDQKGTAPFVKGLFRCFGFLNFRGLVSIFCFWPQLFLCLLVLPVPFVFSYFVLSVRPIQNPDSAATIVVDRIAP